MQIYNNAPAFSVWRHYDRHITNLRQSMQKLASGLRIVNGSDDPAGLAISERLRAQIRNSENAVRNMQNAVAYLQTADGWLQKIHDMLGRMSELSVMSIDATKSQVDRDNLNKEYLQMLAEIQRVTTTFEAAGKYNGLYLLQGHVIDVQAGPDSNQEIRIPSIDLQSFHEEIMDSEPRIYPPLDSMLNGFENALRFNMATLEQPVCFTNGSPAAAIQGVQQSIPGSDITGGTWEFVYRSTGRFQVYKDGVDQGVSVLPGQNIQLDGPDGWRFQAPATPTSGSYTIGDRFRVVTTGYTPGVAGSIDSVTFIDGPLGARYTVAARGNGSGISVSNWRAIYDATLEQWDIQKDVAGVWTHEAFLLAPPFGADRSVNLEGANGFTLTIRSPSSGSYGDGDMFTFSNAGPWSITMNYNDMSPPGTVGTAGLALAGAGTGVTNADWRAVYDATAQQWDLQRRTTGNFVHVTYMNAPPDGGGSIVLEGANGFTFTVNAPTGGDYASGDIFEWHNPGAFNRTHNYNTTAVGTGSVGAAGDGSGISATNWRAVYDAGNLRWDVQRDAGGGTWVHETWLNGAPPNGGGSVQVEGANGFTFTVNAPSQGVYESGDILAWTNVGAFSTSMNYDDTTVGTAALAVAGNGTGILAANWRAEYDDVLQQWDIQRDIGGGTFVHVDTINAAPGAGGSVQLAGPNGFIFTVDPPTTGLYETGDRFEWTNAAGSVGTPVYTDSAGVIGSASVQAPAPGSNGSDVTAQSWRAIYDGTNQRWAIQRDGGTGTWVNYTYLDAAPDAGASIVLEGANGFLFTVDAPTTGQYADGDIFQWTNTRVVGQPTYTDVYRIIGTATTQAPAGGGDGSTVTAQRWRAIYDDVLQRWDIQNDSGTGTYAHYTYLNAAPGGGGSVMLEGANGFRFTVNAPTSGVYKNGSMYQWVNSGPGIIGTPAFTEDIGVTGTATAYAPAGGGGYRIAVQNWEAVYHGGDQRWIFRRDQGTGTWIAYSSLAAAPDAGIATWLEGTNGFRFVIDAPVSGLYGDGDTFAWATPGPVVGPAVMNHNPTAATGSATPTTGEPGGQDAVAGIWTAVYDLSTDTWTIPGLGSCNTGGTIDLPTENGWDDMARFNPQPGNYATGDRITVTARPTGPYSWSYDPIEHTASATVTDRNLLDEAQYRLTYDRPNLRWIVEKAPHDPATGLDYPYQIVGYVPDNGSGLVDYLIPGAGFSLTITPGVSDYHNGDTLRFGSLEPLKWNQLFNTSLSNDETCWRALMYTSAAVNFVSKKRAVVGGIQNRLERALEAVTNYEDNSRMAESRIRDVDMAREMTEFAKHDVLAKISSGMLVHANSSPMSVLELLRFPGL
ncbi:MAG: hypothetical protein JXR37_07000 [Kiritimatiellae bacterium]|nr:hypothetical protein [Kiritimatiellia bacterium]